MKHTILGCAAISALLIAASLNIANAADAAVKAPYWPPAPVYNWTGFYVGVNAGYSSNGSTGAQVSGFTDPGGAFSLGPDIAAGAIPLTSYSTSGFLGGAQLGYNWQIAPTWVVGLETDFMGGNVNGAETVAAMPPGFKLNVTTVTQKLDWLGTTRAKVGYATAGNWLVFGTGGVAYGKVDSSLALTVVPSTFFGTNSSTAAGWAAGGGIEHGWLKWLLRVEYLYYDLGSQIVTAPATGETAVGVPGTSLSASQKATGNLVRAAISYRF